MELIADSRWKSFGVKSLQEFQDKILTQVKLKEQVPSDIKDSIYIVQKLLLQSYYEYEFIDIALTNAVFALERALKLKYKEITGEDWKRRHSFEMLIDWFFNRNYFESWNSDVPHQLRVIRNGKAHSEGKSLGGLNYVSKVYKTIDLINDIYEDTTLRVQRKVRTEEWNKTFNSFIKNGAVISIGNERTIIFKAFMVFINNKALPEVLNLTVWPIFNLNPYKEGKNFIPRSFSLQLCRCAILNDFLIAQDVETGKTITITTLLDKNEHNIFIRWESELYGMANWPMILFLVTDPLNDHFDSCLRKFHQLD